MNVQLTEKEIRDRASDQSFQKGLQYYENGAIYDRTWQSTPGGITLMARCEGSSAPSYRLNVELDEGGVRSAYCTCPYDWGGDCKHIVALLLTYFRQPEGFSRLKSVAELLADLDRDVLVALIARLIERDPDLYDVLETAIPTIQLTTQPVSSGKAEKRRTQVSEQAYRKQVRRILKQNRYDEHYDDEWSEPAYIDDLQEVLDTAITFLEADDAAGALIILRVLLEELVDDYDSDMDYNGDLASVIQDIGMPLAEAILSTDLDIHARQELQQAMQEVFNNLDESIEESDLEVILAALDHGWDELPDEEAEWEAYEEEYWMTLDQLKQARLNVLARQGSDEAFLRLAEKTDIMRYTLKLLELGHLDEAVSASQKLDSASSIFIVAQKMREVGRLADAIALAERGLEMKGYYISQLGLWLAPLEESQGRKEMALRAYRMAYADAPSVGIYRHIKRLAGANWLNIQPELVQIIVDRQLPDGLVDIYLEEKNWDAAIEAAEQHAWSFDLLERVADAVIRHRPDWVIRVALNKSDALIAKTQSNLYPVAASWLGRAKKAYLQKGQDAVWQVYIDQLRATYARRPALQREIKGL